MTDAHYKFSYVPSPDGQFRMAVEVYGPLPDPLAGLGPEARREIEGRRRSWREFIMLAHTLNYPPLARAAVEHHIIATRRQQWEREQRLKPVLAPATAPAPVATTLVMAAPRPRTFDQEPIM